MNVAGDLSCRCLVRVRLLHAGTYLVVELERRPSTPAGALTAFMGEDADVYAAKYL